jgi:hypothetical protein
MQKEIDFKKGVRGKYAGKKIKILGPLKPSPQEREITVNRTQDNRPLLSQDS